MSKYLEADMRWRVFLMVASGAACLANSAEALSGDLAGNVLALERVNALTTQFESAVQNQDAAALARLFTEDGTWITPDGVWSGRLAIQNGLADRWRQSPGSYPLIEVNQLNSVAGGALCVGQWWKTLRNHTKTTFLSGYWSAMVVRHGQEYRLKMAMFNEAWRITAAAIPEENSLTAGETSPAEALERTSNSERPNLEPHQQ